jgi:hypothetical protein
MNSVPKEELAFRPERRIGMEFHSEGKSGIPS